MEDAVCWPTKGIHLELDEVWWELSNQVVEGCPQGRVMTHVHVSLINWFFFILILASFLSISIALGYYILQKGRAIGRFTNELKVLGFELFQLFWWQGTNRFAEISPSSLIWVLSYESLLLRESIILVISDHPGEDWILRSVIKWSTWCKVKQH